MAISYKTGDIFTTSLPAIAHGVNLRGVMGAGIAKQVKEAFPKAYAVYCEECKTGSLKPGEASAVHIEGKRWVINVASQIEPGPNASIELLESGVLQAVKWASENGIEGIAFPLIGAGIGGLHQNDTVRALEKAGEAYPEVAIELWFYHGPKAEPGR